jgi:hypothetical protein
MIWLKPRRIVGFLMLIGFIGLGFLRPASALSEAVAFQEQSTRQAAGGHASR